LVVERHRAVPVATRCLNEFRQLESCTMPIIGGGMFLGMVGGGQRSSPTGGGVTAPRLATLVFLLGFESAPLDLAPLGRWALPSLTDLTFRTADAFGGYKSLEPLSAFPTLRRLAIYDFRVGSVSRRAASLAASSAAPSAAAAATTTTCGTRAVKSTVEVGSAHDSRLCRPNATSAAFRAPRRHYRRTRSVTVARQSPRDVSDTGVGAAGARNLRVDVSPRAAAAVLHGAKIKNFYAFWLSAPPPPSAPVVSSPPSSSSTARSHST
jgi:hypothetical protein